VGQKFEVMLPKGTYTKEDLEKLFSDKDELMKIVSSSVPKEYQDFISGLIAIEPSAVEDIVTDIVSDTDTQAKLIADLKKQIDNLTKQRAEDVKTIQDIADTVIDQAADATHPAAPTTTGATTATTATTAIGQPSTLTPGFRANPYTVSVTPQQMLQQNLGSGATYTAQSASYTTTTTYQPTTVVTTGTTPETGPSEILLIAFIVTFLGLVGWRFIRTFA
jgi:hypothetical protein